MSFLRRLRRNDSGLSALEFAIICPVMLTSLLGAVEVSNGMFADRKVTLVTSTIADLASQSKNITDAGMNDIFGAGAAVMFPMESTPLKMRISSVVADASTGVTKVAWSSNKNWTSRAVGSVVTVPAGMVPKGASVIYAEIEYLYTSSLNTFIPINGMKVTDQFFLRPRRTLSVTRSAN
jgi:Flp pilus assembly protein TadG